ncbi:MAG TPA: hypothetical protein VK942_07790 [Actinomycetes bacterium]|nr:hypothetical protein [Actinomycetes bacterium]
MAIAAYYAWDGAGRPIEPARPIREFVGKMKVAFPKAANLFGWYADDAHYQANFPEDHTPYSRTPWPISPNPYPVVFATDVMHRLDLGVDCGVLFPYWLAEAKAGRMPWLKYMIWQAKLYSVRNNWASQANSGHFDHVHLSGRTDHKDTTLGAWSPVPGTTGDDVKLFKTQASSSVWVSDGIRRRPLRSWPLVQLVYGQNPPIIVVANDAELDDAAGPVDQFGGAGGTEPLTPEQLAEIAAAAKAGAEAGSPSEEFLVQSAFKGAQKAEDE